MIEEHHSFPCFPSASRTQRTVLEGPVTFYRMACGDIIIILFYMTLDQIFKFPLPPPFSIYYLPRSRALLFFRPELVRRVFGNTRMNRRLSTFCFSSVDRDAIVSSLTWEALTVSVSRPQSFSLKIPWTDLLQSCWLKIYSTAIMARLFLDTRTLVRALGLHIPCQWTALSGHSRGTFPPSPHLLLRLVGVFPAKILAS